MLTLHFGYDQGCSFIGDIVCVQQVGVVTIAYFKETILFYCLTLCMSSYKALFRSNIENLESFAELVSSISAKSQETTFVDSA